MSYILKEVAPFLLEAPYPKALSGLDAASEAYLLSEIIRHHPRRQLVRVTPDLQSGLLLKQNLEFFLGEGSAEKLVWFPPHEHLPYTGIVLNAEMIAERMVALQRIADKDFSILVTPSASCFRYLPSPSILKKYRWTLLLNEEIPRERLLGWLVHAGYRQEIVVASQGEFAVRGALIDIFSPQLPCPSRLEFDADKLVAIRIFDPATQTSLKTGDLRPETRDQKGITLIPAGEIVFDPEGTAAALKKIREFAEAQDLPAPLRRKAAEKISAKQFFPGFETFLGAFYENPATFFDYLPFDALVFFPDAQVFKQAWRQFSGDVTSLHAGTKSVEKIIPPEALVADLARLESEAEMFSMIWVDSAQGEREMRLDIQTSPSLRKEWNLDRLKEWLSDPLKTRIICHTPIQAQRLTDLLKDSGLKFSVEIGGLSNGFCWPAEGVRILAEEEIFGHKTVRRTRPAPAAPRFVDFSELKVGDTLVHEDYGINRYKGLKHLKLHGMAGDFLELEFLGGDKLYLPVDRLNAVSRYLGGGQPYLHSLGGTRWKNVRQRARREIFKIAQELLRIHALRETQAGTLFSPPGTLDEEFASHFPYDETPDQAQAIDDVLHDMQNHKPMDRLICGDVGYGKTEVAMRAAFKAVEDGKQVCFLVPTTVLALQHFETFQERFSKLAISVEMLSRFRSRLEQKEILAQVTEGKLDIVIGTHRLLGKDVRFKNLGLLILDEEHRFGVRHKERIKKLRPTVDVLTLSATPIPRTLHMSLIGLKDLSLIRTPPVDRLSVQTCLARWDEALVRHAISKELARGGQVFFVHNRVANIRQIADRLSKMFPSIRLSIAHGQMEESALEEVMIAFLHKRLDILVTTAIIESGIDVPNANTMLINRADTFGLAQLYQLRGRVGRSDRQAYCYLLIPDEEILTQEAGERLKALTRHTELGAGYRIAEHDLEIRGAGNLLGTSQSGFVEEIGYEMYTELLARSIRLLKGEKIEEPLNTEIQLKIPAFIPEGYVTDPSLRMALYKRMAHLEGAEQIEAFEGELKDRFGPLPREAAHLLEILRVKRMAAPFRLKSLQFDGKNFVLGLDPSTPVKPQNLIARVQADPGRYRLRPSGIFYIHAPGLQGPDAVLGEAKKVLSELANWIMHPPSG